MQSYSSMTLYLEAQLLISRSTQTRYCFIIPSTYSSLTQTRHFAELHNCLSVVAHSLGTPSYPLHITVPLKLVTLSKRHNCSLVIAHSLKFHTDSSSTPSKKIGKNISITKKWNCFCSRRDAAVRSITLPLFSFKLTFKFAGKHLYRWMQNFRKLGRFIALCIVIGKIGTYVGPRG